MTLDRWIAFTGGLAVVALIIWFFWLKTAAGVRATTGTSGYQEALILVKGGYTPDTIIVSAARPVRLHFRREETASCSDTVTFPDFKKSVELPTGKTVTVDLPVATPGVHDFGCPMGMFRGRLIVET